MKAAAPSLMCLILQCAIVSAADDARTLRQLGFVAGQAVACQIEEPDVAARVATAIADAMGLTDQASHAIMAEQALDAAARPCMAPAGRLEKVRENWKTMRRRAGVD